MVWVWVFLLVSLYVGPWLVGFGGLVGYVVGCGDGGWLGVTVQKREGSTSPLKVVGALVGWCGYWCA